MELTGPQRRSLDTSKHIAVTAGAGSGKTRILVERYLGILRDEPDAGPRNILALTFTDKAASEMKDRIRKDVRDMAAEDGGRWFDVLEELDEADISTIHSFCTRIVRTLPVQAGVDPDFRVISETEASEMLKEVLNEIFTVEGGESPALRRLLVDYSMTQTVSMLKGLLKESGKTSLEVGSPGFEEVSVDFLEKCLSENLLEAEREMGTVIGSLEDLASIPVPDVAKDRAVALIRQIRPVIEARGSKEELMRALYRNRDLFLTKNGDERRAGSLGNLGVWKGDLGRVREAFSCLFSFVHGSRHVLPFASDRELSRRAADRVKDLLVVYNRVQELFTLAKREANGLDFNDMISLALDLLARNEEGILDSFRKRYSHLLVDEFQDTDPDQWRIVELLWGSGKYSRLFIVGDPKQSIYGFRSADVRLFLRAQESLGVHLSGENVVLDRNFRSRKEIMDLVNGIFPGIMGEGSEKWGVPFDPLEAHRRTGGTVSLVGVLGSRGAERREGEEAARTIKKAVGTWQVDDDGNDRPLRYSDIAVLVPTRKGFNLYEEGMRTHGVPFQVYKGKGFFERQEVADVLNLLSFVTNPNDDLALASVLKGPFFGLSDEDLFRISLQKGPTLYRKMEHLREEFGPDHRLLGHFITFSGALPPHMALGSMLRLSCVYASAGGRREARNLDRVIEWAMEETSAPTMFELAERLRRLVEEPPKEGEPPLSVEEDSVTMMTIHSAKGLEWPMVMVLGMNHEGGGGWGNTYLLDPDNGVSLKVPDHTTGELVKTPSWTRAEEEAASKEAEERKRLLYVAMTRAMDHLVLSGTVPVRKDGVELPPRGMFGMVWSSMDLSVAELDTGVKAVNGVPVSLKAVRPDEIAGEEGSEAEPEPEFVPVEEAGLLPFIGDIEPSGEAFLLSPSRLLEEEAESERSVEEGIPPNTSALPPDEFGSMVHMVLQGIPLQRVLGEFGWHDRGEDIMEAVREIQERIDALGAFVGYHEVEIVARIEDRNGDLIPVLGRMDLLVRMEDGSCAIIDFKTGVRKDSHLKQLDIYSKMLGKFIEGDIRTEVVYSRGPGKV
ncbi:MAG: UvrD-helicase domain-containing protein [Thermoplasmatota archaeon]